GTPSPHSFPTRRSSDLSLSRNLEKLPDCLTEVSFVNWIAATESPNTAPDRTRENTAIAARPYSKYLRCCLNVICFSAALRRESRSEEHTSELQSRENLV